MTLDDSMKRRLTALSDAERSTLDDEARARIARIITSHGPSVVRRARVRRAVMRSGTAVLSVVLAGAAVTVALDRRRSSVVAPVTPIAPIAARGCESFPAGAELGARATMISSADAKVSLSSISPCQAVIALERGRVTIHAHDLGGGELRVHTDEADVVVHGTKFAVERDLTGVRVEVTEGVVGVRRSNETAEVKLKAGQSLVAERERVAELEELDELDADDEPVEEVRIKKRRRGLGTDRRHTNRVRRRLAAERPPLAEEAAEDQAIDEYELVPIEELDQPNDRGRAERKINDPLRAPTSMERKATERTVEELVSNADMMRRAKDYAGARSAYRDAGRREGATAEAAWISLARMELGLARGDAAKDALAERARRFGTGQMAPEAAWILVRAHTVEGEIDEATRQAKRIVRDFPKSPQARAAQKWIDEHEVK